MKDGEKSVDPKAAKTLVLRTIAWRKTTHKKQLQPIVNRSILKIKVKYNGGIKWECKNIGNVKSFLFFMRKICFLFYRIKRILQKGLLKEQHFRQKHTMTEARRYLRMT